MTVDDAAPRLSRIPEIQTELDRWLYHPLAGSLARSLAKTPVSPNMVSVFGALIVMLAGIAYIQPGWPLPALIGLALHMSWHVIDGADGDLARITGKSSPNGEMVDGICDYLGHISLYLLLAFAAYPELGWWSYALALTAGACRMIQTIFHESQRRQYLHWVHGIGWLGTIEAPLRQMRFGALGRLYLSVARFLKPSHKAIDGAFADPARRIELQKHLQELGPASLAGSSLLGSNYRTLALGASMLAGTPLWYFLFEIVFLSIVLMLAIGKSRRTLTKLMRMAP